MIIGKRWIRLYSYKEQCSSKVRPLLENGTTPPTHNAFALSAHYPEDRNTRQNNTDYRERGREGGGRGVLT